MKSKVRVLFLLITAKTNKQNEAPIYCRLTMNKKRRHFSTGFFVPSKNWNVTNHKVKSNHQLSKEINTFLQSIKSKVLEITLRHQLNNKDFSLDIILNELLGRKQKHVQGLLELFEKYIDEIRQLVGKSYAPATVQKFEGIYKQIRDFIKFKYNEQDILLSNLKLKFLLDLEYYLMTERNLKQVSINKTIQRVKKVTKYAIGHEWLDKDPFILYKAKAVHLDVIFLSPEELEMIENYEFEQERLVKVKDCFVFCCYTGLGYREMANLRANHIIKEYEEKDWIKMQRKKTGRTLMIPILPKAQSVLEKYNNKNYYSKDGALLPIISNQRFNTNLKEIAKIIGINKKLSHHVARKTFASTVLLYNDVPMEIVSELLGHSDIKTTQKHYGKIVKKTVSKQVDKLNRRMKLED